MGNDNLTRYMDYIKSSVLKTSAFKCKKCEGNSWIVTEKKGRHWGLCTNCGKRRRISDVTYSNLVYKRIDAAN